MAKKTESKALKVTHKVARRTKTVKAAKRVKPATATKRVLNCVPSRSPDKDWRIEHAAAAGIAHAPAIPVSKDLREAWWEIGNQVQTGSCVGWSTADGIIRWHMVKAGMMTSTDHLSVRFLWMSAKETDEFVSQPETFIEQAGTSIKAALNIARKYGAVLDAALPFGSGELYPGDEKSFYATASTRKIKSYFNLGHDPDTWRRWIANSGPIAARLDVDQAFFNATQTRGQLVSFDPSNTRGGHAVTLVGYDANGFIVRNSWGTGWGDQGFGYASIGYAKAAFTEAYGISV